MKYGLDTYCSCSQRRKFCVSIILWLTSRGYIWETELTWNIKNNQKCLSEQTDLLTHQNSYSAAVRTRTLILCLHITVKVGYVVSSHDNVYTTFPRVSNSSVFHTSEQSSWRRDTSGRHLWSTTVPCTK